MTPPRETYLTNGKPKNRCCFNPRYHQDLQRVVQLGGDPKRRGGGRTVEGPLHSLMALPIEDVNADRLQIWYDGQAQRNASQAARALVMLRGFLRWCQTQPQFAALSRTARDAAAALTLKAGPPARNRQASTIDPAKLPAWWAEVLKIQDKAVRVYLQMLLMTGLRCACAANLNWSDCTYKAEFGRYLLYFDRGSWHRHPLTDDVLRLLGSLPKSRTVKHMFSGKKETDRMPDPRGAFRRTLIAAGIEPVPIYALQRTFAALAFEAGVPLKVVAQCTRTSRYGRYQKLDRTNTDPVRQHLIHYEQHLKQVLGVKSLV